MKGISREWTAWVFVCTLVLSIFLLSGCGTGRTMVMKPPEKKITAASVDISETKSTVEVPDEVRKKFGENISQFCGENGFAKGSDLKIR